jgi:two-component system sensor histidine kinase PhoQ
VKLSINSRMLIAASIILFGFLGVTGLTLEGSFRATTEEAFKERLQVHLNTLIASAEVQEDGTMRLVYALPESRFFVQSSGLYAKILGNDGKVVWSSPSLQGMKLPISDGLKRGEVRYQYLTTSKGEPVLAYMLGVTWGEEQKSREGYTFAVAENLDRLNEQLNEFRKSLWGGLGGVTLILLMMLTLILRWGLAPLREVAEDLQDIEAGRHLQLHGKYPKELRGLTDNLNALIRTNREHEERYQASLGDLAHSLKTPLSVLRGAMELPNQSVSLLRSTVEEQVERKDQIVQYQLQRAATSGRTALMAPVDLQAIVHKVAKALKKVYADKGIDCRKNIEVGLEFHCQEGDMMELFGNLLDNAFKWCRNQVEISIRQETFEGGSEPGLLVNISDDGPGIEEQHLETVLSRGGRADTATSGHGLGLAMVQNIVELYGGRLRISRAALGGANVTVWLPLS